MYSPSSYREYRLTTSYFFPTETSVLSDESTLMLSFEEVVMSGTFRRHSF